MSRLNSIARRWPGQARWGLAVALLGAILLITGAETGLFGTTTQAKVQQEVDFGKTFTPNIIGPGSTTTLSFTIINYDPTPLTNLAFADTLPSGVVIATPANALASCAGTLVAPDGGDTISFSAERLGAYSACILTVDVIGSEIGIHQNVSGQLTSDAGEHGNAVAELTVSAARPGFSKSFSPGTIPPGGDSDSTLTFVIDNTANDTDLGTMSFNDTLPAGMVIAALSNASTDCGHPLIPPAITAVPGTNVINFFASGSLPNYPTLVAGSSCSLTVDVTTISPGIFANVSSELLASGQSSGFASAVLEAPLEFLIKSFSDDPVPPGGDATLEFTLTNVDRANMATDITFSDDLQAALAGLQATGLPLANPCGAGSQLAGTSNLVLSGGELQPESSCTFSVTLQTPLAATPGVYVNTTSAITAQVGGDTAVYDPATDRLFVWPAPLLTKSFDDPVAAGDTVTLTFTITNTSPFSSVTDIAFTDEHTTIFPFGTSVGLPSPGFCGASSVMSIITSVDVQSLSMTGGSLEPGASCTFEVTFQSLVGMPGGVYHNTTSPVAALVGDLPVVGAAATDDLVVVAAPVLHKSFDDPVLPGETVTLTFSISHDEFAPGDATNIAFTDNLAAVLTGLTATGLPASDVCGAGSQISGTTNLDFTGGNLAPGETCVFSVTLQVTDTAVSGIYANTTSNVTADVAGLVTTGYVAQDNLDIGALVLSKSFTDDPTIPGDMVTLEFTIVNSSTVHNATNIQFTDNLNDVVSGLAATDLPKTDVCGAGSSLAGTTNLTFQGGSLDPETSCTFTATLQVPADAASNTYVNVTTLFRATIAGGTIMLVNAMDELVVSSDVLLFAKSFTGDPVMPGDALTLTFTLTNLHATQSVADIAFSDDLDAALAGLVAVGLPASDVCGAGSQISGTSQLDFTGGMLGPGAACSFDVALLVPEQAAPGEYDNATGDVAGSIGGLAVRGDPARDSFLVNSLTFSKSFDGPSVAGGNPTLVFEIHNPSTGTQALGISFLDDLEAVIPGLVTTGLPQSDVCGSGSLLTGLSFLTLVGGSLEPEASCTFSVTLQVPQDAAPGEYVNTTSDLTLSGLPVGDPASAALSIEPPPLFSKNFAPNAMQAGEVSTLTFTIDNSASALAASDLDFADDLPSGVLVASLPHASTTCDGGALTAVAGASSVGYSGGAVEAGASCTVQVDVTSSVGGEHVNTTGDLTSSSGNSGPASDTLFIGPVADLSLLKRDSSDPIEAGAALTYTLVVSNSGPSQATGVVVTDALPGAFTLTGNTCGASGDPLVWDVDALPAGGAETCAISGLLDAGLSGELTNTASVASDIPDPQPDDNTVTETTLVYQLASIGDYVWLDANMDGIQDAGESGMPGVTVNLRDGANTTQLDSTTTNASGFYSFTGLLPGDYMLEFVLPPDHIFSFPDQGADDVDSDPNVISGQTVPTALSSGEYDPTWDAGMINVTPANVGDYVWNDDDGDGLQDAGEAGINGVTVNLWYDSDADDVPDSLLATTTTTTTGGQDGLYEFASLPPSRTYQLEFVAPPGYVFSPPDQGADDADSDADPLNGLTPAFVPTPGENILNLDAGLYLPALSVAKSVGQTTFITDRVVITYNITITNVGTVLLSPVVVTDTLDDGLTFISANPPGSVLLPGQSISWDDVTDGAGLAPAATVQIVLQAVAYDGGPYSNLVEATGVYPGGAVGAADQVAVRGPTLVYLPLLLHNYRPPTIAPDLVVDAIVATREDVQVTISNQGNAPVTTEDEFYVQVYVDPDPAPAAVNELWYNLGDQGLFWGVTADLLPLAPGVSLTLTYNDAHYMPDYSRFYETLEPGTPLYAQVDTWGDVGDYGAVLESHEILGEAYNNILGPVPSTANAQRVGAWHRR